MVGFELLGSPQRDLTPEYAAARLREASELHYTVRPQVPDGPAAAPEDGTPAPAPAPATGLTCESSTAK